MVFYGSNSNRGSNRHRRIANGATYFPFWEDGRLVQDRHASAVRTQLSYGPSPAGVAGIGDIELVWASGIGTRHLLTDHRGSVLKLQNKAGTVTATREYNAFGQTLSETGTWLDEVPYGYQSNWQRMGFDRPSANGVGASAPLYLSKAGVYDAETGRFLYRDPIVSRRDPLGLGGLNLYTAFGNNPVNVVDPIGLAPTIVVKIGSREETWDYDPATGLWSDIVSKDIYDPSTNTYTPESGAIKFTPCNSFAHRFKNAISQLPVVEIDIDILNYGKYADTTNWLGGFFMLGEIEVSDIPDMNSRNKKIMDDYEKKHGRPCYIRSIYFFGHGSKGRVSVGAGTGGKMKDGQTSFPQGRSAYNQCISEGNLGLLEPLKQYFRNSSICTLHSCETGQDPRFLMDISAVLCGVRVNAFTGTGYILGGGEGPVTEKADPLWLPYYKSYDR